MDFANRLAQIAEFRGCVSGCFVLKRPATLCVGMEADRDAALPSVGRVRRVRTAIGGAARPEGRCASEYDDDFAGVGQSQPTPAHYTTTLLYRD